MTFLVEIHKQQIWRQCLHAAFLCGGCDSTCVLQCHLPTLLLHRLCSYTFCPWEEKCKHLPTANRARVLPDRSWNRHREKESCLLSPLTLCLRNLRKWLRPALWKSSNQLRQCDCKQSSKRVFTSVILWSLEQEGDPDLARDQLLRERLKTAQAETIDWGPVQERGTGWSCLFLCW